MILLISVLVILLIFLYLIMPRMLRRPDVTMLMGRYYAHRGLHDNSSDAPENSLEAIRRAVHAGYGIEFDVQLTQDRIPVVFHDENLKRVCGIDGNVRDFTYEELCRFPLFSTNECIPTLEDVLAEVDGRVPLIIEIKVHEPAHIVCAKADELIAAYKGLYCIESFHPYAVKWYKEHRPHVIRGQLSANLSEPDKPEKLAEKLVHHLLTNVLTRPDFIAYDHHAKENLSRRLCRKLFGALSVAWTVKSQQELDESRNDFDLFIFEQFIPE